MLCRFCETIFGENVKLKYDKKTEEYYCPKCPTRFSKWLYIANMAVAKVWIERIRRNN